MGVVCAVTGQSKIPFKADFPCLICGGHEALRKGQGVRCYGFIGTSDRFAFCTREEYANGLELNVGADAYVHLLVGSCACGVDHEHAQPVVSRRVREEQHATMLDPDTLHEVISFYLQLCPIRPEHEDFFGDRGEIDLEVSRSMRYGSLPLGYNYARTVRNEMIKRFGEELVRNAPGFYYRDGKLTTHTAKVSDDAAVVASVDHLRRYNGLIRRDPAKSGDDDGKYKTFYRGGSFLTFGPVPTDVPMPRYVLVEGIHKANVVARLRPDVRVVGLSGTRITTAQRDHLKRLEPHALIEAYDADQFINGEPSPAKLSLHRALLKEFACPVRTWVWPMGEGKGLDDLLKNGGTPRERIVPREVVPQVRKPIEWKDVPAPPTGSLQDAEEQVQRAVGDFINNWKQNRGKRLLVLAPPGVGKTREASAALNLNDVKARYLVGTLGKVDELVGNNTSPDYSPGEERR